MRDLCEILEDQLIDYVLMWTDRSSCRRSSWSERLTSLKLSTAFLGVTTSFRLWAAPPTLGWWESTHSAVSSPSTSPRPSRVSLSTTHNPLGQTEPEPSQDSHVRCSSDQWTWDDDTEHVEPVWTDPGSGWAALIGCVCWGLFSLLLAKGHVRVTLCSVQTQVEKQQLTGSRSTCFHPHEHLTERVRTWDSGVTFPQVLSRHFDSWRKTNQSTSRMIFPRASQGAWPNLPKSLLIQNKQWSDIQSGSDDWNPSQTHIGN